MSEFGITNDGIKIKRLPDIIADINKGMLDKYPNFDVSDESPFGQVTGVLSAPIAFLWEQFANAYYANNPITADGVSFDYCAAFNNLKRLAASQTRVELALELDNGTSIGAGELFKSSANGKEFGTIISIGMPDDDTNEIYLRVNTALDSTFYSVIITINGNPIDITYESSNMATIDEIAEGLAGQIEANTGLETQVLSGEAIYIYSPSAPFTLFNNFGAELSILVSVDALCTEYGDVTAPAESINSSVRSVAGLISVINYFEGIRGRKYETTPEFKIRRKDSLNASGSANLSAIVASVKNIQGVTTCKGNENDTDNVVGGLAAHSILIVADGGDEQEIAETIYRKKAVGIATNGAIIKSVIDGNGDTQFIRFGRPIPSFVWIRISITLYNEETFPAAGINLIRQNVLEYGEEVTTPGLDIIPVRFTTPVLKTSGIETILTEIAVTETVDGVPEYVTDKISIDNLHYMVFNLNRIIVQII